MIKPATLWTQFKTCNDPVWLGKLCMALGGQEVDLDFGQKQMVIAIQMDSGWMDERIEAQRERWRERDKKRRNKKLQEVSECENGENGEISQSHASHDTSVRPSVRPSLPPSVHNNNNNITTTTPYIPQPDGGGSGGGGGGGEVRYSRDEILSQVTALNTTSGLREEHIVPFTDYLVKSAALENDGRTSAITNLRTYINSIYRRWCSEGADAEKHRVTRSEFSQVVAEMNTSRDRKISKKAESECWDWLQGIQFDRRGNEITKWNVRPIVTGFIKKRDEDLASQGKTESDEEAEQRRKAEAARRMAYSLAHETDD